MLVAIEDIVFMDDDPVVFTEGVNEYWELFKQGKPIEPVAIFHQEGGKYFARGDRHRTYMYYHRARVKRIDVVIEAGPLDERDRFHLQHGCVTIHDLREENLLDE
jgi:hypothetical protein